MFKRDTTIEVYMTRMIQITWIQYSALIFDSDLVMDKSMTPPKADSIQKTSAQLMTSFSKITPAILVKIGTVLLMMAIFDVGIYFKLVNTHTIELELTKTISIKRSLYCGLIPNILTLQ